MASGKDGTPLKDRLKTRNRNWAPRNRDWSGGGIIIAPPWKRRSWAPRNWSWCGISDPLRDRNWNWGSISVSLDVPGGKNWDGVVVILDTLRNRNWKTDGVVVIAEVADWTAPSGPQEASTLFTSTLFSLFMLHPKKPH